MDMLYLTTGIIYLVNHQWDSHHTPKPMWFTYLYPYFLYPLTGISHFCTIYMVVALSIERRHAICSPLTHEPKVWPYIIAVIFTACEPIESFLCTQQSTSQFFIYFFKGIYKIPRFFDFHFESYVDAAYGRITIYDLTLLFYDVTYQKFTRCCDLVFLIIIPLLALCFCNINIYLSLFGPRKHCSYNFNKSEKISTAKEDVI